ncbi:MAG: hypothetical protein EKK41_14055 [Hyphomicrobiales bacterium]|nr:MAG: hypothetical protein EKK41_14055 [Hyphomicrobiales bacterium]
MRSLVLACFAVAGFAMLGTTSSIAAPAGGTVLAPLSVAGPITEVRCRTFCRHRWYSRRRCWRQCW